MSRVLILPPCSICQDESSTESYVFTLCGHAFHSPCIRAWDETQRKQRRTTKCPTCNTILKRISPNRPEGQPGSRFVTLHSLTERILDHPGGSQSLTDVQDGDPEVEQTRELMKVIRDQRNQIEGLKSLPHQLELKNSTLQEQLSKLQNEFNTTNSRHLHMSQHMSLLLQEQMKKRQEDQQKANSDISELNTQLDSLRNTCTRLRSEVEEMKKKYNKQKRELEESTENMLSFSSEADSLRESRDQLTVELKGMKANVRSLQQRSAVFETKYQKYKTENLSLKAQLGSSLTGLHRAREDTSTYSHILQTPPNPSSSPLQKRNLNPTHDRSFASTSSRKRPTRSSPDHDPSDVSQKKTCIDEDESFDRSGEISFKDPGSKIFYPGIFGPDESKRSEVRQFGLVKKKESGSSLLANKGNKVIALGPKIRNR